MLNRLPPRAWQLLVIFLILAVYAPVARLGFASDDLALVVDNPFTSDLANVPGFFFRGLWAGVDPAEGAYFRPVMLASLAVDRALWGLSAPIHHLHSLVWHLLAVGAAMVWVERRIGLNASLTVGLVFGLHPVQSEVVAFVSARNDALAVALGLCGALVLDRGPVGIRRAAAGGVLVFLAMCAKEIAVVGALAWLAAALALRRGDRPRMLAVLLAACAYVALRVQAVGVSAPSGDGGWAMLLSKLPAVVAHYAALLAVPWPLSDAVTLVYLPARAADVGVLAAGVFALALAVRRGGRVAVVGLVVATLLFVPVVPAIASKKLLADRYLYAPMLGIAVAVAATIGEGVKRQALTLLWVPVASLFVGLRLPAWESSLTLAQASAVATPSAYAEGWLGIELIRVGRSDEAAPHLMSALTATPPYCPVGPLVVAAEADATRAVALGQLVYDHGCAGVPDFREEWALAHVRAGQIARASRIMEPRPACDAEPTPARVALAHALDGPQAASACASAAVSPPALLAGAAARLRR